MKTYQLGIRQSDDDAEIKMMLESVGVWAAMQEALNKLRKPSHCNLFLINIPETDEQWIVQEFCGVPGDEGYSLITIPRHLIHPIHPAVFQIFVHISKFHKLTLESFKTAIVGHSIHDPRRN